MTFRIVESDIHRDKALCSVDGCNVLSVAKGYCASHYQKAHKHGDPLYEDKRGWPVNDRFWLHVNTASPDGCWIWTASVGGPGYAQFNSGHGKMVYAHRFSWMLANGDIPKGMFVCHKCDNKRCVNPSHLFLGTPAENSLDMKNKGRQPRGTRNGNAKLSYADVRAIREAKETQYELAKRFHVSQSAISLIKTGKLWAET